MIKKIICELTPPLIIKALKKIFRPPSFEKCEWTGDYKCWNDAVKNSGGYDRDLIFDKVRESMLKVKNGQAAYERDSVAFREIEYSWPLLSSLLWIALNNQKKLNLIDFGGALGSTYYQNANFLKYVEDLKWNVVEQEKFVGIGKRDFETAHLRFFYDVHSCFNESRPETILFSSVIQYLENPYAFLEEILKFDFEYIIFDRTPFFKNTPDRITVQKVPPSIYDATYPCRIFNLNKFMCFFSRKYDKIVEFDSNDAPEKTGGETIFFKGALLRKKR